MAVILTQCKCIPNHHVVHLKYITIWFVNCTPIWASLVAQLVKNPPAVWETWVRSLGWEDPLEKGTATHSVFWPGELHGLYSPWAGKESGTTERFTHSPQYSLKNKKMFLWYFKKLWMTWLFSDNTESIHDLKSENKNKCNAISSDTNPMILERFIALNLLWCIMNKGHDVQPSQWKKKKG